MIIGLDVDEVLRDFVESLKIQYKKDYPDHEILPITSWDLSQFFPIGKEIEDYFRYKRAKEIYETAPVISGAEIFTQVLRHAGHKIILITAQPSKQTEDSTLNWIHHKDFAYDAISFSEDKSLIKCDIYLDDAPHNIKALRKIGRRAVYFTQPWNIKEEGERVFTLPQFYELIQ